MSTLSILPSFHEVFGLYICAYLRSLKIRHLRICLHRSRVQISLTVAALAPAMALPRVVRCRGLNRGLSTSPSRRRPRPTTSRRPPTASLRSPAAAGAVPISAADRVSAGPLPPTLAGEAVRASEEVAPASEEALTSAEAADQVRIAQTLLAASGGAKSQKNLSEICVYVGWWYAPDILCSR